MLQPGAQTQTVTVTSEAVQINTNDATLGGTITQENLADLPINGRDFKAFFNLRPGVSMNIGGGYDTVNSNGPRASDTGYLLTA